MELTTVWFLAIAALWIGYFVLEGFDFGVGMLLRVLGRNEPERRAVITTIGPVWDGNEVWLIVAGGATFAAFPEWYATLFSGFYLPLFAILVSLILRGVALEYRGKRDDLLWRGRMDTLITIGSVVPGVPVGTDVREPGPRCPAGRVLRVRRESRRPAESLRCSSARSRSPRSSSRTARSSWPSARPTTCATAPTGWLPAQAWPPRSWWSRSCWWAQAIRGDTVSVIVAVGAVVAFAGGLLANRVRREGWAFVGTALAIALAVTSLFAAMFPAVMPSTLDPGSTLTTVDARQRRTR